MKSSCLKSSSLSIALLNDVLDPVEVDIRSLSHFINLSIKGSQFVKNRRSSLNEFIWKS